MTTGARQGMMTPVTSPTPPGPPLTAQRPHIPGVRLVSVIGKGGFATVYGGVQDSLEREVAVKVDSRPLDDERNRRRYLREVQAAGRITGHPHVVSLIDTGVLPDARPYIVMERCDGGSLADLAGRGPVPAADAVALVAAASSALGAAHAAGVLHRDVKPANILLDSYGSPRLTDFGIAAVERQGQDPTVTLECLTPDFACPEAFSLGAPRPSGDVWSMGAVLYFLLTGRGPRRAHDGSARSFAEIVRILDMPVELDSPLIPAAVRPVLNRAMHVDPGARYPDGKALAEALAHLEDALGGGELTVTGPEVALRLAQAGLVPSSPAPPSHQFTGPGSRPAAGARPGDPAPAASPAGPYGGAAVPVHTAGPASTRRRRSSAVAVGAAGLVLGLVLGVGLGRLWASPSQASAAAAVGSASPVPPAPAATSPSAPSQAPASAPYPVGACLEGMVVISGVAQAQDTDCAGAHAWEVFAVGTLAESTDGFTQDDLQADPSVKQTCTRQAATDYGEPDPDIGVLGPSEVQWSAGNRGFSCLVSPAGGSPLRGSYSQG